MPRTVSIPGRIAAVPPFAPPAPQEVVAKAKIALALGQLSEARELLALTIATPAAPT